MATTTTDPDLIEGTRQVRDAVMRERYVDHIPHPVLVCAADRAGVYELRNWIGARTIGPIGAPGICSPTELYFHIAHFAGAKGYGPLKWAAEYDTFSAFADALIDQHPLAEPLNRRLVQGLGALIGDGDMTSEGTVGPGSIEAWLAINNYRAWFVDDRVWNGGLLDRAIINLARRSDTQVYRFGLDQKQQP